MAGILMWHDAVEVPPITDCNEVWPVRTLMPYLHVSGMTAGVWNKDLIAGIGNVRDDKFFADVWLPDDTGGYKDNPGYILGSHTGLPEFYHNNCQWYAYTGPSISNKIAIASYGPFLSSGIIDQDQSESGLGDQPNTSVILTDNDPGTASFVYLNSALSTINKTDGYAIVARALIEKDLTAENWSIMAFAAGETGSVVAVSVLFNQATGEIKYWTVNANDTSYEINDNGRYWEITVQMDGPTLSTTNNGAYLQFSPCLNLDGVVGNHDGALVGYSLKVVDTNIFSDRDDDLYTGLMRRIGTAPQESGASYIIDQSIVYLDPLNHSGVEGGYFLEYRPQYKNNEITRDVEILSLNDTTGLLYYDYLNHLLTATNGINTATVPLTLVIDKKYRIGIVFGDFLMVGVNGEWGDPVAYDIPFPEGGNFSIFRNPQCVNLYRELSGYRVSSALAKAEITNLMQG